MFDFEKFGLEQDAKTKLTKETSQKLKDILAPLVEQSKSEQVDLPTILADLMELGDLKEDYQDFPDVKQLYVEWALDVAVSRKVKPYVGRALEIYEALVAGGYSEENAILYNDLDNKIFYIPSPEGEISEGHGKPGSKFYIEPHLLNPPKIFVVRSQNYNFLYILLDEFGTGNYEFHIRQYYDVYAEELNSKGELDSWDLKEKKDFLDKGKEWAIRESHKLHRFADDILGNSYPERPSLEYFRKDNFKLRYEDFRDVGYVISYKDSFRRDKATDGAIYYYSIINNAIWQLMGMLNVIREDVEEQVENES